MGKVLLKIILVLGFSLSNGEQDLALLIGLPSLVTAMYTTERASEFIAGDGSSKVNRLAGCQVCSSPGAAWRSSASQGLKHALLNQHNPRCLRTRVLMSLFYFSRLLTDEPRKLGLPAPLHVLLLAVGSRDVLLPLTTVVFSDASSL